eukprot:g5207.t1
MSNATRNASAFNPTVGDYGGADDDGVGRSASAMGTRGHRSGAGYGQNEGNSIFGRPSTKVHAPPGGASAFGTGVAFGAADAASSPAQRPREVSDMSLRAFVRAGSDAGGAVAADTSLGAYARAGSGGGAATADTRLPAAPAGSPMSGRGSSRSVSSNAFASGANQNCGNVITDRATSRVLAPPGGLSSVSLG